MRYILISPTPTFSKAEAGYICQKEWYRPLWAISKSLCSEEIKKSEWLAINNDVTKLIQSFLLENPKVIYMNTFAELCPDDYCPRKDQNSLIYRDRTHLSSYGAMKLKNTFENFVYQNNQN